MLWWQDRMWPTVIVQFMGRTERPTLVFYDAPPPHSQATWKQGCYILKMVTQSQHRHCTDRWYLQGWGATHTDYDTMIPSSLTSRVQECFNAQSHLGWTGFLEGFLTTNLAVVKQDYFTCKGSWQTGHRWIVNVSKQLWQLVFTHWTHQNH